MSRTTQDALGTLGRFFSQAAFGNPYRTGSPNTRFNSLSVSTCFILFALMAMAYTPISGQEANWIWTAEHPRNAVPQGDCFFRKTFHVSTAEQALVIIGADDEYELFVNGRQIGKGESTRQLVTFDIQPHLVRGRNVIAVRVRNTKGTTAAMAARVQIKPDSGAWTSYSTDRTWRTALEVPRNWTATTLNDARWGPAEVFGLLGETPPWDRREDVAASASDEGERFRAPQGFSVERILDDETAGSLIAMAFNEFGHVIASQEGGPLLLFYDSDKDGKVDRSRVYCDAIKNIQGILPLNGEVFVTGEGGEGSGLYRLTDADHNGTLEKITKLVSFAGSSGEHGAHGITLGPDGMLYIVVGNHQSLQAEAAINSTYRNYYEGDLVQPRMEDPGGHARGVKAPGGTIVRTDLTGQKVEVVAGGIRNAYDIAFNEDGSLFLHDSDMEADIGAAWHRPTQLFHVIEGAEMGWRSGWSTMPAYYPDRILAMTDTGRGSPTGAIVYDHFAFPARYHRQLFLADWSEGRILAVRLTPNGSTYQAQYETFVQGQPLNVTDLDVGPDGALYFCTGGRGTNGGLYRVSWQGEIPDRVKNLGDGITKAIRFPQIGTAWARQEIAMVKKNLGDDWNQLISGVASSDENPTRYRIRALDLMQWYGPKPTPEFLIQLSKNPSEALRHKAARLLALQSGEEVSQRLKVMLKDSSNQVALAAAEGLLRQGAPLSVDDIRKQLTSEDKHLAWVARKLLERIDPESWKTELVQSDSIRERIVSSLALMTSAPTPENAKFVIEACQQTLNGFVSDRDFIELLRVLQVALHQGKINPLDVPELKNQLVKEFPAGEALINHELIRLLTYLQAEEVIEPALVYLTGNAEMLDKILISLHVPRINHAWNAVERFALLRFYEMAQRYEGGSSVPLYVMTASREFGSKIPLEEARIFVSEGDIWPNAALSALPVLPAKLEVADREALIELDKKIDIDGLHDDVFKRLKTGIVAILARSGDEASIRYLREIWRRSPDRRAAVALALADQPGGDNWDYLVRSLGLLEPDIAAEIMQLLVHVELAADDPEAFRQVILVGIKLTDDSLDPKPALDLLEHWTGVKREALAEQGPLSGWQAWYTETYPDRPEAALPSVDKQAKWNYEKIVEYLEHDLGKRGSLEDGKKAFTKAQCAACHRFQGEGTTIGPDLTAISRRFTQQETLEAILYPSHVISDQYASKKVRTRDGDTYIGIVTTNGDGSVTIRKSDRQEITITAEEVDEIASSKISLMPSGLLEDLSAPEIRDMLTYMGYLPTTQEVAKDPSKSNTKLK
jgi:putative membrane-bound dehydrogenase-like protein